jgi:hypothetical protein
MEPQKSPWAVLKESPAAAAKKAMYQEAIISGCWIYSKVSKKWYTPLEFMNSTEVISESRGRPDASNFAVKHPLLGLQERINLLKRTQEEIDSFNSRIHNYYELKMKK